MTTEIRFSGNRKFFTIIKSGKLVTFDIRVDNTDYSKLEPKQNESKYNIELDEETATQLMIALQKILF